MSATLFESLAILGSNTLLLPKTSGFHWFPLLTLTSGKPLSPYAHVHLPAVFTTPCFQFQLFVDYFMEGNMVVVPVIEHMIEAWNLRHHPNMCFLFYEDMKKDLRSQLRKVAQFLGKSFSDEQIDKLAEHLHIDNFRHNPWVNVEDMKDAGVMHKERGSFIRRGKTGDWKNHFTADMTAKFDKWMSEKLKGTDLHFIHELDKQD